MRPTLPGVSASPQPSHEPGRSLLMGPDVWISTFSDVKQILLMSAMHQAPKLLSKLITARPHPVRNQIS